MEKMLLTEALDERDFLKKKISDKISKFGPLDFKINSADKCGLSNSSKEDFDKDTKAEYQSIMDLIKRYDSVDAAIIKANSEVILHGDYVDGLTIAQAISLRENVKDSASNFYYQLENKFTIARNNIISAVDKANSNNRDKYDKLMNAVMSRTRTEADASSDSDIEALKMLREKDTTEVIDPLGIDKVIEELGDRRTNIVKKINSAIKIANATTSVEF